jgi:hypothetical protein
MATCICNSTARILAAVFSEIGKKLFCKSLVSLVYVLYAALSYRKLNCKTPCRCLCSIQNAKRRNTKPLPSLLEMFLQYY